LVPVDKAANNIAFICKALYVDVLRKELTAPDGGAYVAVDNTVETVIRDHNTHLAKFGLAGDKRLGYLYWIPKMHKEGQRFIAAMARCTTRKCSSVLSDVLGAILAALRDKDDDNLTRTGVRRFFVVPGYEEVADFLPRWESGDSERSLYTGDFSTMYTTIPHDDLIRVFGLVLDEAWAWKATQMTGATVAIEWKNGAISWVSLPAGQADKHGGQSYHRFSLAGLKQILEYLIRNVYVVNGGSLRRQTIGLPMGTNCAPSAANLYLYGYESAFIDRLVLTDLEAAAGFHMTFRLIDDVLSVDNPVFREHVRVPAEDGGLYPQALSLNETSIKACKVSFLGMMIVLSGRKLHIDVFDKRREFRFAVIRYPNLASLIPTGIIYGVFLGQLHRYYRICTEAHRFLFHARVLARTLRAQGAAWGRLRVSFRSFVVARGILRWRNVDARWLCERFEKTH
jgi:hypothetical protein